MNSVILCGRLTKDPEVRYSSGERQMPIARYTLAVDRRGRRGAQDNQGQTADFIPCVAFDRAAEFAEKYLKQGTKMIVRGRIQTGSYTNRDGQRVYTTEVIIEDQEFAESRNTSSQGDNSFSQSFRQNEERPRDNQSFSQNTADAGDGFMNIPDGVSDEGLPFS
ncbi:MAG: single-stranded DNA-binding protein [Lachnospiraceae bacterium]|jgi:single-strand DNA-binding protein|nr:single-stranded DNA-binding protein [Lachnospiraceae bacterium]MBQ7600561.1 single-stranded DNA-binding protein [Lachnospiraceae bacterium]MBR6977339.1 single-stranded DNA-binding protein [Lachnospiraceae bacterium]